MPSGALWPVVAIAILHSVSVGLCFFIDDRQSPAQHEWNYARQHEWPHEHRECAGNAQSPINIQHRNVIVNNHLRLHFYNYNQFIKFTVQNAHHTIKMNPIESSYLDGIHSSSSATGRAPKATHSHETNDSSSTASLPDLPTADEDLETEFETARETKQQLGRGQPGPSKGDIRGYGGSGGGGQQLAVSHADETYNEVPPYGGSPTIKLDWLDDGNNEYKLRDIHFHWGERRDNGSEHAIEGKRAAMEVSDIER